MSRLDADHQSLRGALLSPCASSPTASPGSACSIERSSAPRGRSVLGQRGAAAVPFLVWVLAIVLTVALGHLKLQAVGWQPEWWMVAAPVGLLVLVNVLGWLVGSHGDSDSRSCRG